MADDRETGRLAERPLKIALLSEFAYPFHKGGAERRYYELASRLVARGHEIHWYAMPHWPGGESIVFEGIRLHAAGRTLDVYADSGGRSVSAGLRVGLALTTALTRAGRSFDVVDCSLYPFFHIFGARLVRPRTPTVVSWYEFWGDHWYEYLGWRGFFGKQIEVLASRAAHRVVSVSELAADGLRSAGVPEARLEVVPLGVDAVQIAAMRAAATESDVVSFGRLKNHKNIDVLLRAIARVRETRPDVTCTIVGDGPERGALERLARELGLERNVRFHGEAADDAELFAQVKAARVFVNASTKEGGGSLTLLEANACGLPVIAVRHELGIDASLIEEGRNGWWATSAEPDAIAGAITTALDAVADESARARWVEQCQSVALAYDWDAMASRCERIYRDVAGKR